MSGLVKTGILQKDKTMIIRPMTEDDVEAVFLIEESCFPDPWSRKSIRGTLREQSSYMLVAEENGKVLSEAVQRRILLYVTRDNRIYNLKAVLGEEEWDY